MVPLWNDFSLSLDPIKNALNLVSTSNFCVGADKKIFFLVRKLLERFSWVLLIDERPKIAKTLLLRHVMRRVSKWTSFLHKKPQSKTVDDEICESNNAFCMIEYKRRSKEFKEAIFTFRVLFSSISESKFREIFNRFLKHIYLWKAFFPEKFIEYPWFRKRQASK